MHLFVLIKFQMQIKLHYSILNTKNIFSHEKFLFYLVIPHINKSFWYSDKT